MSENKCKLDMANRKIVCKDGKEYSAKELSDNNCKLNPKTKKIVCDNGEEIQLE